MSLMDDWNQAEGNVKVAAKNGSPLFDALNKVGENFAQLEKNVHQLAEQLSPLRNIVPTPSSDEVSKEKMQGSEVITKIRQFSEGIATLNRYVTIIHNELEV